MKEAKHTKVNMVEPYQFEPEYNEDDEWESLNEDESGSDQESDRLQSNDWCICGLCIVLGTDAMSCCYKELEIFKLKTSDKLKQITFERF